VFLPMILDNEPKPLNQDIAISIPPIPKPENAQMPAPVQADTPTPPAPVNPRIAGLPEGNSERQIEPPPEPTKTVRRLDPKPAPTPAPKHDPKPVAASVASGDESFVVQLGAFSNSANAKALQRKLQDNKFKAYTEIVKSTDGDRTRVRVGPYPTREAAENARERLKARKLIIGDATVVRRD
ncbi:MAG: SPOR domain-containing protein, partial [Betaproteobacteria bacterium]